jgi:hypothetical protein
VIIITYHGFYKHRSLFALMMYYTLMAVCNLLEHLLSPSSSFLSALGLIDNYLDAPLMLIALLFFCPNKQKQKMVYVLTASFIAFELVISIIYHFKRQAVITVLGADIAVILVYTFFLFVRQIKFTVMHRKNTGRTLMLASILFSYGSFAVVYYFYYILQTPDQTDSEILYNILTTVSSLLMSVGIQMMSRRIKELHSLKITRKELEHFFTSPVPKMKNIEQGTPNIEH